MALIFDNASTAIVAEYSDYSNVFSAENTMELPEYAKMNDHTIVLEEDKQLPFGQIYSLRPVKLKILKTYIKTILVNSFIPPSKSPVQASILFNKKLDGSLRLCIDYQGLNNITIKNRYLLPLICELLDQLVWAKRFT